MERKFERPVVNIAGLLSAINVTSKEAFLAFILVGAIGSQGLVEVYGFFWADDSMKKSRIQVPKFSFKVITGGKGESGANGLKVSYWA